MLNSVGHGPEVLERRKIRRLFRRSDTTAADVRAHLRIGIPRVLNLYSTAPLFRTYFESLGIPSENICFSPATSEEMSREGAKYDRSIHVIPPKSCRLTFITFCSARINRHRNHSTSSFFQHHSPANLRRTSDGFGDLSDCRRNP